METSQVISLIALAVAVLGFLGNTRKETRSDAAALAIIETKLDTIISSVNEVRVENKSMQQELRTHGEKLVELEARLKSNTHRLDALEGIKQKEEDGE